MGKAIAQGDPWAFTGIRFGGMRSVRKVGSIAVPMADQNQAHPALGYAEICRIQESHFRKPAPCVQTCPHMGKRATRDPILAPCSQQSAYIFKNKPSRINFFRKTEIVLHQPATRIRKAFLQSPTAP